MKYEFKAQIDASKKGHHEKTAKQPKLIAAVLEEKTTQPSLRACYHGFMSIPLRLQMPIRVPGFIKRNGQRPRNWQIDI